MAPSPRFRLLAWSQVILTITFATGLFFLRTRARMAEPAWASVDLYAQSWTFQWLVFGVLWLPLLLLALSFLLLIEYTLLSAAQRHRSQALQSDNV
ncbi:MAG: hypothetical protein GAK43_01244 [Stenotrophomonas maltophilia]|nr:MAG: hypothetical protein GAK43_01244 [Stenotrophomonas maltophilia]